MIQITKQIVGENRVVIKLRADSKLELVQHFYYYINYGESVSIRPGTEIEYDTGLTYLNINQNEAYFTANLNEFIKTLAAIELMKLLNELDNYEPEAPKELLDKAERKGLEVWKSIAEENILNPKEIFV